MNPLVKPHWLIVKKDQPLMETIQRFVQKNKIASAHISAIGALKDITLGFYHLDRKEYERRTLAGEYELLSLSGNISEKEGELFVHAHVQLSDEHFQCTGGHLFAATVAITAEVMIAPTTDLLMREYDNDTGLFLINS